MAFAVVMAFLVLGLLGLVCDTAVMFVDYNRMGLVAEECAQAAISPGFDATSLDIFYHRLPPTGPDALPTVDMAAANNLCSQMAAATLNRYLINWHATITATPGSSNSLTVAADVGGDAILPAPLWGSLAHLHVVRIGQLTFGP